MEGLNQNGIQLNIVDGGLIDCLDQEYKDKLQNTFTADPKLLFRNLSGGKNWLMETIKDYQDRQKRQFRQKVVGEIKFINGSSVVFKPLKDFIDLNPPKFISGRIPNLKVRKRKNESTSI